ncbi:Fe-S cluster assembly iron-binding protein IscA [Neobacillus sp. B4I6]|jgi:Fe-S cluster assembly iron-binding protein IscA|uniref:HesB/IscA family protein n=1 Tax=Bacillaceae TaxID=186817 RepID=UPI001BE75C58|nr:iron-sulfur cluster biosynthesis family protein [Bacillus sp. ISL-7]MBT2737791.1 iron-sulfur cluster biosynthesis family protein [Bacillus sp. ISL-7]
MMIKMTEAAMNKLKEMSVNREQTPRIDAEVAGGCGMTVKFSIVFDEPRRNDLCIETDGIQIRLDRFTKRYLDEETQIDYRDEQGFLVGESFASSACAIEFD